MGVQMGPEDYEPLSFADNVLVMRIKLSCAAFGLFVFALLADWIGWPGRALVLVLSAALVLLACLIEGVLRRLAGPEQRTEERAAFEHYLIPF
jgi:hypothetical protein